MAYFENITGFQARVIEERVLEDVLDVAASGIIS